MNSKYSNIQEETRKLATAAGYEECMVFNIPKILDGVEVNRGKHVITDSLNSFLAKEQYVVGAVKEGNPEMQFFGKTKNGQAAWGKTYLKRSRNGGDFPMEKGEQVSILVPHGSKRHALKLKRLNPAEGPRPNMVDLGYFIGYPWIQYEAGDHYDTVTDPIKNHIKEQFAFPENNPEVTIHLSRRKVEFKIEGDPKDHFQWGWFARCSSQWATSAVEGIFEEGNVRYEGKVIRVYGGVPHQDGAALDQGCKWGEEAKGGQKGQGSAGTQHIPWQETEDTW